MKENKSVNEQLAILSKFRCKEILEWAKYNTWFDTSFVRSIYTLLDKGVALSANQIKALKNIHEKCSCKLNAGLSTSPARRRKTKVPSAR